MKTHETYLSSYLIIISIDLIISRDMTTESYPNILCLIYHNSIFKYMRYFNLLLLMFFSTLFLSCNKDDDSTSDNKSDTYWNCKLAGEDFNIEGTFAYAETFDVDNTIAIYGTEDLTQSDYTTVFISLKDSGKVGTYDLGFDGTAVGTVFRSGTGATFISGFEGGNGILEITKIDSEVVEGTFEFTAVDVTNVEDPIKVTDGSFSVKF